MVLLSRRRWVGGNGGQAPAERARFHQEPSVPSWEPPARVHNPPATLGRVVWGAQMKQLPVLPTPSVPTSKQPLLRPRSAGRWPSRMPRPS